MKLREMQSLETKQKIFSTALALFDEKGYDNVTINDICHQIGLTKGAFYHHFNSKSDILIMKYKFNENTLQKYYQSIASEKPPQKLEKIIKRFIDYPLNTSLEEMKSSFKVQIDSHYQEFVGGDSAVQKSILMKIITEGQTTGDFRNDLSADMLADIIIRYKFGIYIEWCIKDGDMDITTIAKRDYGALLNMLIAHK
jgi:Transcriptional regulator